MRYNAWYAAAALLLLAPPVSIAKTDDTPLKKIQELLRNPDSRCEDLGEAARLLRAEKAVSTDISLEPFFDSVEFRIRLRRVASGCIHGPLSKSPQTGTPKSTRHPVSTRPPLSKVSPKEALDIYHALMEQVERDRATVDMPTRGPILEAKREEAVALAMVLLQLLPLRSSQYFEIERSLFVDLNEGQRERLLLECGPSDACYALSSRPFDPAFNWPPPVASEAARLEASLLRRSPKQTLGDVDALLTRALQRAGYAERGYLGVPGGFALVTRLEQIDSDGRSLVGKSRWASDVGPLAWGVAGLLGEYLKALFQAPRGYFRMLVFIVTDQPFAASASPPSKNDGNGWVGRGLNQLPSAVAAREYTQSHGCTILIYEFESTGTVASPTVLVPGRLSADTHLRNSGLLAGLVSK